MRPRQVQGGRAEGSFQEGVEKIITSTERHDEGKGKGKESEGKGKTKDANAFGKGKARNTALYLLLSRLVEARVSPFRSRVLQVQELASLATCSHRQGKVSRRRRLRLRPRDSAGHPMPEIGRYPTKVRSGRSLSLHPHPP